MSRKRPLHRYPEEFYELFSRAQRGPFTLEFDSHVRARSVRNDLYNLRAAVRERAALDPNEEEISEHLLIMENVVLRVHGNLLKFSLRTYTNAIALKESHATTTTQTSHTTEPPIPCFPFAKSS